MSAWRARAVQALIPILPDVREHLAAGRLKAARAMVKAAYPFGLRRHHPYKVWGEEVRRYLPGLYPRKSTAPAPGDPSPLFE